MNSGRFLVRTIWFAGVMLLVGVGTSAFGASETVFGIDRQMWSSFWRVVNFLILVYLLNRWLKEPVKQFFRDRFNSIVGQFQELEEEEKKLSERRARQNELFDRLDDKIREIRAYYEQMGKEEKERLIRQAEELKRKTLEDARIAAEREFQQAKKRFREEVVDLAVEMAEERIRRSIGYEDHQSLIFQYVEMLEARRPEK
ncbi:ATP synthase F0 subunit B [Thermodesulforhabdus norvegica]|uniref:ATP synthase subunit b n=1 Tax=Thermodesulforhabdus norvegica TaxID=39841 RepID=A0A1I4RJ18_9BACT|nr:ATP synthase F0 subunit B [Thermodesulforhabdus norvegica]SFM52238.1 F-type H+-transporting ATPase subunit b [Thermodesulforhabdus norvegica]